MYLEHKLEVKDFLGKIPLWRRVCSVKSQLILGFASVLTLMLVVSMVFGISQQYLISEASKPDTVEGQVTELGLRGLQTLLKARRVEREFLQEITEIGLAKTKTRYLPLLHTHLADLSSQVEKIRSLSSDAGVVEKANQILQKIQEYEKKFVALTDLYQHLGYFDIGWQDRFRLKTHEIEALITAEDGSNDPDYQDGKDAKNSKDSGNSEYQAMMFELQALRRYEKDYIRLGHDAYLRKFLDGMKTLRANIGKSHLPTLKKQRISTLLTEYSQDFLRYTQVADAAIMAKDDYVAVALTIEPLLEELHVQTSARLNKAQHALEVAQWSILLTVVVALLLAIFIAVLISWRITSSITQIIAFAKRITAGDFNARVAAIGEYEIDTLGHEMNQMAESLMNFQANLEGKAIQLEYQANHDILTGLPNRNLFVDRLHQALVYAQRHQRVVVVAFLNLNKFKSFNDSLGREFGDQLLLIMAERLRSCVRKADTVARLGADEFALILHYRAGEEISHYTMRQVFSGMNQPISLNGREYTITSSIGFAVYPQNGEDADTLLKNADTAMYRAKEGGRENFQFYTATLPSRVNERAALELGLQSALAQNEFSLHYQPRIELKKGKISGLEVLLRWSQAELGAVAPLRFIPLAEELGIMHLIGDWVMRTACLQQIEWKKTGVANLPVAVNVSAVQFLQQGFSNAVARVLHETQIDPAYFELEITESFSMQDPEATIRVMHELKSLGIRLSIDNFGTGYSNLGYLKRFPVDKIKLDLSFVRDIVSNDEDLAVSDAVISMAHSLHLKVIAEGVESEGQLALLADHGCNEMQGYYFSKPLPVKECTNLLMEDRAVPANKLGRRHAMRSLLLVDDEPQVLIALEHMLQSKGYNILTAHNAMEAFNLLATNEIGVVLCDYSMPNMTGIEFFHKIKRMHPAVVRILLTDDSDKTAELHDAFKRGGVYQSLRKPWDEPTLLAMIEEALRSYEYQWQITS